MQGLIHFVFIFVSVCFFNAGSKMGAACRGLLAWIQPETHGSSVSEKCARQRGGGTSSGSR